MQKNKGLRDDDPQPQGLIQTNEFWEHYFLYKSGNNIFFTSSQQQIQGKSGGFEEQKEKPHNKVAIT